MANFLYVDNSNVWIEGMHVAAVESGLAPDIWTALEHKICDYSWKMDFGKLFAFAGGDRPQVARAVLFGSRPPKNDSLWEAARITGFEVIVHDRNIQNREKKVDTEIVANMLTDSYESLKADDEMTLVAGDKDFVPAIIKLVGRKIPIHVVFWDHAARELRENCTKFVSLNPYIDLLKR